MHFYGLVVVVMAVGVLRVYCYMILGMVLLQIIPLGDFFSV